MLKISFGKNHPQTTLVTRDGKLLPVVEFAIHCDLKGPIEVYLTTVEADGKALKYINETVLADKEPIEIVGSDATFEGIT